MPFNLASNHIYVIQLCVCTSRHLNLYKIEQIDIHVLHVIFCPTWCPTCNDLISLLRMDKEKEKLEKRVNLAQKNSMIRYSLLLT